MGTHRRRLALIGALTAMMMIGSVGTAFAHVCFNANKPVGAGSAGSATIVITEEGEQFIPGDLKLNPQGRLKGGFLTLTAELGDGTQLGTIDTFAHNTLPEGAMNAGPGDDLCDGIGIDNAEACLAP